MSFGSKVENGYLSFAKGLVTEYNPLAAPEGTTFDELNMDIDTDGFIRTRRPPLEAALTDALGDRAGSIEYSAVWEDLDKLVVVIKTGLLEDETENFLIDVIVYDTTAGISRDLSLFFSVPQDQYVTPTMTFLRRRAILILGGAPLLIEPTAEAYNVYEINLLVRDFKMLDDGLGTSTRPVTLDDQHKYNLLNSGWWQDRRLLSTNAVGDPITDFFTIREKYPSNADVAYLGDVTDTDGDLKFKPLSYDNIDVGSTEAPRGHYIYNVLDMNRNARLAAKTLDGSQLATLVPIVEDGNDPDTGLPPDPGTPVTPPPNTCLPGETCTIEP